MKYKYNDTFTVVIPFLTYTGDTVPVDSELFIVAVEERGGYFIQGHGEEFFVTDWELDNFCDLQWTLASELVTEPVKDTKQRKCDCGGFKVYNTMSPESHSYWCAILE